MSLFGVYVQLDGYFLISAWLVTDDELFRNQVASVVKPSAVSRMLLAVVMLL